MYKRHWKTQRECVKYMYRQGHNVFAIFLSLHPMWLDPLLVLASSIGLQDRRIYILIVPMDLPLLIYIFILGHLKGMSLRQLWVYVFIIVENRACFEACVHAFRVHYIFFYLPCMMISSIQWRLHSHVPV